MRSSYFEVKYTENALKALKRLDKHQAQIIISWIEKNLVECENPRLYGKPLDREKKGYWRYRLGAYRIIADIRDSELIIVIINTGHRKEVYD